MKRMWGLKINKILNWKNWKMAAKVTEESEDEKNEKWKFLDRLESKIDWKS